MRTTVTLPDDVFEAAKTLADGSGRTLGEVLAELVRRGLRPQAPGESEIPANGLPCFPVPPDAELIPGSRAQELLAAEGAE
jgi:hypothetical protein